MEAAPLSSSPPDWPALLYVQLERRVGFIPTSANSSSAKFHPALDQQAAASSSGGGRLRSRSKARPLAMDARVSLGEIGPCTKPSKVDFS